MRRIKYSAKRSQIKVEKSKIGKFNLENDVIHDALKLICNRNLKKMRWYWAFSEILALEVFDLKVFDLTKLKIPNFETDRSISRNEALTAVDFGRK